MVLKEQIFEFNPTEFVDDMVYRVQQLRMDFCIECSTSPDILYLDAITARKLDIATRETNVVKYSEYYQRRVQGIDNTFMGFKIRVMPIAEEFIMVACEDNYRNIGIGMSKYMSKED